MFQRSGLALCLVSLLFSACAGPGGEREGASSKETASAPAPFRFQRELRADTLLFRRGDSLDGVLRRADLPDAQRQALIAALVAVHDPGSFRAGSPLILLREQPEGGILGVHHPLDFLSDLAAWRVEEGFRAERFSAELPWQSRSIGVELEGSFYEGFVAQGENGDLATRTADLFAGEIDFFFDLRPGDRMELLLESARRPDRAGRRDRILAARMEIGGIRREAFLFPDAAGRRRYFHRDGSSLERQFLRAPLSYSRISSGFSSRRLHPILKVRRPHFGVDYAAPVGTPVLATADGSVIRRARESGAGRFIRLRHAGQIETTYMHLSRWGASTSPGSRVRKGQVIGYVGSSGLSTGPHLDYRIKVKGRYVDPRRFSSPPSEPLAEAESEDFRRMLARYDSLWTGLDDGDEDGAPGPLSLSQSSPASSE